MSKKQTGASACAMFCCAANPDANGSEMTTSNVAAKARTPTPKRRRFTFFVDRRLAVVCQVKRREEGERAGKECLKCKLELDLFFHHLVRTIDHTSSRLLKQRDLPQSN
jgi:hypothetical protein